MTPARPAAATADEVDASLRQAHVVRRGAYDYVIHPLMDGVPRVHPALLQAWVEWAAPRCEALRPSVLLAPEAMALPLVAALSLRLGVPYVIARKRPYGLPGEARVAAATGYGRSDLHVNGLDAGDRVLVVDDVLSTGGTLRAVLAGIASQGATAVGALVFLDKATADAGFGVPVQAMRRIRIASGRVELR